MRSEVRELLRDVSFEIFPADGIADRVRAALPPGTRVSVTVSPRKGLEPTLAITEQLQRSGYSVMPHLAARMIGGDQETRRIAARLHDAGVDRAFVIAGDAPQTAGPYPGSAEFLRAFASIPGAPSACGIAGYPEGHPFLNEKETVSHLLDKAPFASWIVTQMSFDIPAIAAWTSAIRKAGVHLPVVLGVPGAVGLDRLISLGAKAGVASAARLLRKQTGVVSRLVSRRWSPEHFIAKLISTWPEDVPRITGLHIYTFNDIERTVRRIRVLEGSSARE